MFQRCTERRTGNSDTLRGDADPPPHERGGGNLAPRARGSEKKIRRYARAVQGYLTRAAASKPDRLLNPPRLVPGCGPRHEKCGGPLGSLPAVGARENDHEIG